MKASSVYFTLAGWILNSKLLLPFSAAFQKKWQDKLEMLLWSYTYISICVQGLTEIPKYVWSQLQPGDCSWLVLNFWANLSLGVLTKFVLI